MGGRGLFWTKWLTDETAYLTARNQGLASRRTERCHHSDTVNIDIGTAVFAKRTRTSALFSARLADLEGEEGRDMFDTRETHDGDEDH